MSPFRSGCKQSRSVGNSAPPPRPAVTWLYRVLQKGLCASGGNQGSGNGGQTSGGSNDGAQAGKPAGDKAQGGKSANSLASTGDQTVATVAAIGGLGAAIAAIGVFLARFRRKED